MLGAGERKRDKRTKEGGQRRKGKRNRGMHHTRCNSWLEIKCATKALQGCNMWLPKRKATPTPQGVRRRTFVALFISTSACQDLHESLNTMEGSTLTRWSTSLSATSREQGSIGCMSIEGETRGCKRGWSHATSLSNYVTRKNYWKIIAKKFAGDFFWKAKKKN